MEKIIFSQYLKNQEVDKQLGSVLESLQSVVQKIAEAIKTADTGKAGSTNVYGEEQLALDVLSDKMIQDELKANPAVGLLASEEMDDELKIGDGEYAVCYDPLDGSSLVDVNLAVGSIFGIYKTGTFLGRKGDEMLASLVAVYGPRTTILLTVKKGVVEFGLKGGEFVLTNENIRIINDKKMFAPGNLRACKTEEGYVKLMEYWMKEQYTLRYSGGMVPDINQILLKGRGVFTYPGYAEMPEGKLRLLFECNPMSLLVEQAGGKATNGKERILELEAKEISQRTPIFIGAIEEVDLAEKYLGG
ncbi:MAG TPA: fructose-1,6-bisphosphatase [Candidatus Peregrinibacteria bacterium]|nr:fructose-1,6-bisphosphatase [Candidatus Peregrinibacteria bacterium]